MNQNRNSSVAFCTSVCALCLFTITLTTTSTHSPAVASVPGQFPANEGTRADLPEYEQSVLDELHESGLLICDRFT
jgi:hypothetical protein